MYRVLVGKPKGKETTGETEAQMGSIIFRWIFREWGVGVWTGLS
jgi:hypothetical protein